MSHSHVFEKLIDSYIDDNVGIAEGFLNTGLASRLRTNLERLYKSNALNHAGTGNQSSVTHDKLVRSDKIYWLDKSHNDAVENEFFLVMDDFIRYLNETCFTGITGYEFHYAMYEKGSFYKRHVDRFRNDDSRLFSMITYLNPDWSEGDGGELCIYHADHKQQISPIDGKSIFFRSSDLEHEVLLTHVPRMSITGWLKR
ncbi:MAG: 2OG-Fe(II) oxygenase [Saprospiraceae bacterium]|nr:2OG-Fe(II) oxygenase [Saprospiraceae bacterium]MBK8669627.1 2OG-Fe(II) oxygenase [Saprospiraceae bacterium]MBL0101795.1 2OG-Fe(II) oxygenase [Saprospiraceae bacterium]